jgi:hypothetical protein
VQPVSAQTKAQAAKRGAVLALDLLAFNASLAPAMEHAFGRAFICPVRAKNMQRLPHCTTSCSHGSAKGVCPCRPLPGRLAGVWAETQCCAMPVNQ